MRERFIILLKLIFLTILTFSLTSVNAVSISGFSAGVKYKKYNRHAEIGKTLNLPGWTYRKQLTFNNSAQNENLVDFPVLVKLTTTNFNYSHCESDGIDVRFLDSDDSTELEYHFEEWNYNGDSYIWVKVPQIDGLSSADFIWMYYGNPSASDNQNAQGVWDSHFRMVQHLNNRVQDVSNTNSNHGIAQFGSDTFAWGKLGRAGSFDGAEDYVSVADNNSLDNLTAGSIELWYRPNYTGAPGSRNTLVSKTPLYGIQHHNNSELRGYLYNSSISYWSSRNFGAWFPTAGQWYHIVFTWSGSEAKMYVDGTQYGGTYATTYGGGSSDINLHVAAEDDPWNTGARRFTNGSIDELAIWNYALSLTEVSTRYNSGNGLELQGNESGLISAWHMNENSWQIHDIMVNSNDGTACGGANHEPGGKMNGALNFVGDDGSANEDSFVNCGNNSSLNTGDFITVECWLKIPSYPGAGNYPRIVAKEIWDAGHSDDSYYLALIGDDNGVEFCVITSGTLRPSDHSNPLILNQWHYIVGTYDGLDVKIFINGTEESSLSGSGSIDNSNLNLTIASRSDGGYDFVTGAIDEVRISDVARSEDWIAAQYLSMDDNFINFGAEVPNQIPVADAGPDQSVDTGDLVQLDGASSYDPDGDPFTYNWYFVSVPVGSTAVLSDPAIVDPTFTADIAGNYIVRLIVNDGTDDSLPDEVIITAGENNRPPVADAGPDQSVITGDLVQLDGSSSYDPDGHIVSYKWDFGDVSTGSGINPVHLYAYTGEFTVILKVTDNNGLTSTDTALVKVCAIYPPVNLSLKREINRSLFKKEAFHTLEWSANSGNIEITIIGYRIYRKKSGEDDENFILLASISPGTFRYVDGYLDVNEKFVYALTSVDSSGHESERSASVAN